jgi:hypothetical protein
VKKKPRRTSTARQRQQWAKRSRESRQRARSQNPITHLIDPLVPAPVLLRQSVIDKINSEVKRR